MTVREIVITRKTRPRIPPIELEVVRRDLNSSRCSVTIKIKLPTFTLSLNRMSPWGALIVIKPVFPLLCNALRDDLRAGG